MQNLLCQHLLCVLCVRCVCVCVFGVWCVLTLFEQRADSSERGRLGRCFFQLRKCGEEGAGCRVAEVASGSRQRRRGWGVWQSWFEQCALSPCPIPFPTAPPTRSTSLPPPPLFLGALLDRVCAVAVAAAVAVDVAASRHILCVYAQLLLVHCPPKILKAKII